MQTQAINANIMSILIEQCAQGVIRPASLVSAIQPGTSIHLENWSVSFKKVRPGEFTVNTYQDDQMAPLTSQKASTPVEAKLITIDLAIEHWRQLHLDPALRQPQG